MWDDTSLSLSDLSKEHFGSETNVSFFGETSTAAKPVNPTTGPKNIVESLFTFNDLSISGNAYDINHIFNQEPINTDSDTEVTSQTPDPVKYEVVFKKPSSMAELISHKFKNTELKKVSYQENCKPQCNRQNKSDFTKSKKVCLLGQQESRNAITKFDFKTPSPDAIIISMQEQSSLGYS